MMDDDLDALAAEYVLGTLSAEERSHAETMIAVDSGFIEIVRQWERRLGELNVMVEAVEPPPEIWDKIKSDIPTVAQSGTADLVPPPAATLPPLPAGANTETKAGTGADFKFEEIESALSGALAARAPVPDAEAVHEAASEQESEPAPDSEHGSDSEQELVPEVESEPEPGATSPGPSDLLLPPSSLVVPQAERSADVILLRRRVGRWRRLAVGCGALAAALAALIVVSQVKPGLIAGRFHIPQLVAQSSPPPQVAAAPPGGRLIGVLQQDPSAPAFLLTIDPAARKMTVRTVAAKGEANHSFELWLVQSRTAPPLSLGLIGSAEYTELSLPADLDAAAMAAATYAVSFEPAGGSKTGAPTGPILFTGKLIESRPPPSSPKI
jgi:anti-sigma-K factor RskA